MITSCFSADVLRKCCGVKTSQDQVAVLAFFVQQRGSVKNNCYSFKKNRPGQIINFPSIFAKNG